MLKASILALGVLVLAGCAAPYPVWSNASAYQKGNGFFIADENFYNSQQHANEIDESAETIIRLSGQRKNTEPK